MTTARLSEGYRAAGRCANVLKRRGVRLAAAILLLLLAVGCTETPLEIPVLPPAPTLALVERGVVGDPRSVGDPIGWVVVAPGGTIYIGHPVTRQIEVVDRRGASIGRIGGLGRGEGEFQQMEHAGTLGDSLWIYDGLLRRVTVFTPELSFARSFRWPPPADPQSLEVYRDATVRYLLAITPEGRIVSSVYRARGWSLPDSISEFVVVNEGSARTAITDHPVPPAIPFGSGFELRDARLFPVDPIFVPSSDGTSFLFVDPHLEGTDAGTFTVTRFNAAGDTLFSRKHLFYPVEIPQAVRDGAVQQQLEILQRREASTPGIVDAFRKNLYIPPVYPPVLAALPGRDGSTWIRMHPLVEGNTEYYVLDSEGGLAGRLSVPGSLEIVAADADRVWALKHDSNGTYRLFVYDVAESSLPAAQND